MVAVEAQSTVLQVNSGYAGLGKGVSFYKHMCL